MMAKFEGLYLGVALGAISMLMIEHYAKRFKLKVAEAAAKVRMAFAESDG